MHNQFFFCLLPLACEVVAESGLGDVCTSPLRVICFPGEVGTLKGLSTGVHETLKDIAAASSAGMREGLDRQATNPRSLKAVLVGSPQRLGTPPEGTLDQQSTVLLQWGAPRHKPRTLLQRGATYTLPVDGVRGGMRRPHWL